MKFSIITTFYNNKKHDIDRLKKSILNQTYTKWEWIIGDDFSNEINNEEYLKSFSKEDKRIKYVEQKFKKEIFWNPQTYASGDIVMLIGSDDYIKPKTLEIFNYHFIKYPEVILITSEASILVDNGIVNNTYLNYKDHGNLFDSNKELVKDNRWLRIGVPLTWRNVGVNFTDEFEIGVKAIINDYLIHTKLEEMGKFIHLPRPFYMCNIRNDSVSRKKDDNNDYNYDTKDIDDKITKRREGKEINSAMDIYNDILDESKSFYFSKLNEEKYCNDVSFITKHDLNYNKKLKIKELYIDHNIYFNKIGDMDYYIFYFDNNSDISDFTKYYEQISNYKEIIVFCIDNGNLHNEIKSIIGGFHNWFIIGNEYTIMKSNEGTII